MYIGCGIRLKPIINLIADKNLTPAMALGTRRKDTALCHIMRIVCLFSSYSQPSIPNRVLSGQ